MGDERWPKICLKEEMRNWENGNASKWIKDIEDQTAQEDWYRMDTSRYCPVYGEQKKIVAYEKYWGGKDVKLKVKEQWAKMRCGNI